MRLPSGKRIARAAGIMILFFYFLGVLKIYWGQRIAPSLIIAARIEDKRVLELIDRAERIVGPEVDINYYSIRFEGNLFMPKINAFYLVSGIFSTQDLVFISEEALDVLNDEELIFVIGHELGHSKGDHQWRNRGIIFSNKILWDNILRIVSEYGVERWIQRGVNNELEADEAGVKCSGPEAALKFLEKMTDTLMDPNDPIFITRKLRISQMINEK